MNESAERDRIKAIINSDGGKAMASLANHLAFETDVSAEAAGKILAAGKADMDAVASTASAKTSVTEQEGAKGADKGKSFVEHKAGAGTLGLGTPEPQGAAAKADDDGWGKAVALANPCCESGNFT